VARRVSQKKPIVLPRRDVHPPARVPSPRTPDLWPAR
jgi:hypothetical protein